MPSRNVSPQGSEHVGTQRPHKYRKIEGHSIACLVEGDGPPLILLHGIPTNSRILLHLSGATGVCGWRALYPIEVVKRGGSVDPKAIFGDEDCYNGVTVDDWPAIE